MLLGCAQDILYGSRIEDWKLFFEALVNQNYFSEEEKKILLKKPLSLLFYKAIKQKS